MPYTLVKFFLWALLLGVIGGVIGWLLRSLTCRAEMARLRAIGGGADELERLRARSAELDSVTAERDRLRMEIADVRGSSAGTLGFASTRDPGVLAAASTPGRTDEPAVDAGEVDAAAEPPVGLSTLVPSGAPGEQDRDDEADGGTVPSAHAGEPAGDIDLAAAATVLGRPIHLDDLTVIEGIGPKIAELCAAIGIDTWRALAATDVTALRSMLDDAGARFKMHQPDSWPEQAALLVDGRWEDFEQLTAQLEGDA